MFWKRIMKVVFLAAVAAMAQGPGSPVSSSADTSSKPVSRPKSFDLSAMDKTVNPCEDFYEYACGTWRKNNPIPADQSRWGRFNELEERNLAIERGLLEKAGNSQIGEFYAACMDEAAIERRGMEPI